MDFIFVRETASGISALEDLGGRRVAAVSGFATRNYIEDRVSSVRFIEAEDILGALRLVIAGEADAFVGENGAVQYVIEQNSLAGLKIAADS